MIPEFETNIDMMKSSLLQVQIDTIRTSTFSILDNSYTVLIPHPILFTLE